MCDRIAFTQSFVQNLPPFIHTVNKNIKIVVPEVDVGVARRAAPEDHVFRVSLTGKERPSLTLRSESLQFRAGGERLFGIITAGGLADDAEADDFNRLG